MKTRVRIYAEAKKATQSGRGHEGRWILHHMPFSGRLDTLTGWTGNGAQGFRLYFATRAQAIGYAERHGFLYRLEDAPSRKVRLKSYASNFTGAPFGPRSSDG